MGVTKTAMWVINLRTELIAWYERCGYVKTGQTLAFPVDAGVRTPILDASYDLLRLEKPLVSD